MSTCLCSDLRFVLIWVVNRYGSRHRRYMSKARLMVDEASMSKARLIWWFPSECAEGGHLCPYETTVEEPKVVKGDPDSRGNWEIWVAVQVCKELRIDHDTYGFFWPGVSAARKALASINKRVKAGPDSAPDVAISAETAWAALRHLRGEDIAVAKHNGAIRELQKVLRS